MAKILLVEDDEELAEHLKEGLSGKHTVDVVLNGIDGEAYLQSTFYDLAILDWELPGASGVEVLCNYRKAGGQARILLLTGKTELTDKVRGFTAGADDYLTKPFMLKELELRIEALLRRPSACADSVLEWQGLSLDSTNKLLNVNGQTVELRPKEYAILEFLIRHAGETFTPEALLERLWSRDSEVTSASVYTFINLLRKKLTDIGCGDLIHTIRGKGYRLERRKDPNKSQRDEG